MIKLDRIANVLRNDLGHWAPIPSEARMVLTMPSNDVVDIRNIMDGRSMWDELEWQVVKVHSMVVTTRPEPNWVGSPAVGVPLICGEQLLTLEFGKTYRITATEISNEEKKLLKPNVDWSIFPDWWWPLLLMRMAPNVDMQNGQRNTLEPGMEPRTTESAYFPKTNMYLGTVTGRIP